MPHIDSAGVHTYYEDLGHGDPVVLLHGGLESGADWAPYTQALGDRYRVLVPDRRGHGHTPDVEGPYTYEAMAAETVAFLEQQADTPVSLVGYSDGGIIALLVTRDRPDLVRGLVAIGTNFHVDGLAPQFLARLDAADPFSPRLAPIRESYEATSPDGPAHWPTFYRKVTEMGRRGPTITIEELGRIDRPALVIVADDDVVTLDHAITMFDSLSVAQLAVMPGTSHLLHHERPGLLTALIESFLADPTPRRLMPIRTNPQPATGGDT